MEQAIRATGSTDNDVLRDWLAARTAEEPVQDDPRRLPLGRARPADGQALPDHPVAGRELKFVYPVGQFPGTRTLLWHKPAW